MPLNGQLVHIHTGYYRNNLFARIQNYFWLINSSFLLAIHIKFVATCQRHKAQSHQVVRLHLRAVFRLLTNHQHHQHNRKAIINNTNNTSIQRIGRTFNHHVQLNRATYKPNIINSNLCIHHHHIQVIRQTS